MADRSFNSPLENAVDDPSVAIALLVYMNWPGGAVRFWSGAGTLTAGGDDYVGAGQLGTIDKITDSTDPSDIGVELRLNYLDDDVRNEIVTSDPVGVEATISLALIDTTTMTVTDTYTFFVGFVDEVTIEDEGDTGVVKVRLASELARLKRSHYYTLTDAHQQALFSGDVGMEFATKMTETIFWGQKPVNVGGGTYPAPPTYDYGNWWAPP